MRPLEVLALLVVSGCSTYVLRTGDRDPGEDLDPWDDTEVWGETCPDLEYDGWQTTGSPGCRVETEDGEVDLADLTLAPATRCEVDCDEDRVVVWLHPGNRGRTDLTGAWLTVWRLEEGEREELDTLPLDLTLRQLWYEDSVQIDLSGHDLEDADAVVFSIESDQPDCDEGNDEHNELGPFCD